MKNDQQKLKKTFKECWIEEWKYRKWGVYIGLVWLVVLILYDFIKRL